MKYTAVVTINVDANSKIEAKEKLRKKMGECEIVIKNKTRSSLQNRALHLWYTQLADLLNSKGLDMRTVIRDGIDIQWSAYTIKEHIWRPTMITMFGNKSTKDMKTSDIDAIFNVVSKAISERTGEYLEFPSMESLMNKQ